MLKTLSQNMKNWSTSVDTKPGQVDTRDRSQRNKSTSINLSQVDTREPSQKACFSADYGRSTLLNLRSTLDASPRELFCPVWDSVSTHSGNFLT
ncbi:hypothetical protein Taro_011759, partial [Colocasia esculenta]|nr:hypothetical protein [Colocasia esculenta]